MGRKRQHLYFLRERYSGLIKIGASHDPGRRVSDFSWNGRREDVSFEVLAVCEDEGHLEYDLHRRFSFCRAQSPLSPDSQSREWFHPSPELLAFVEKRRPPESPPIEKLLVGGPCCEFCAYTGSHEWPHVASDFVAHEPERVHGTDGLASPPFVHGQRSERAHDVREGDEP